MKDETAYALTAILCVGILVVSMGIAAVVLKSNYRSVKDPYIQACEAMNGKAAFNGKFWECMR